ncbi:MAG: tyrosine-type recombinase/integrase [Opitutaceae bacterium]|nr:tyrosine-type recombinase/integrase [Opitutaceae bacterium]
MSGARALTPTEIPLLLSAARTPKSAAFLLLGISTGFRCRELLCLRFSDVSYAGQPAYSVTVPRRLMKNGRSATRRRSAQGRTVPLNAHARAAIALLLREAPPPTRYLFASRVGGNRPVTVQMAIKWVRTMATDAGIDPRRVTTHSLRKTFAMRLHDITGSVVAVSRGLGHRSLEVTAAYLDIEQQQVDDAVLAMAAGPVLAAPADFLPASCAVPAALTA